MANVKITGLTAITAPANTDVLPIVDVSADVTKKVSVADLLESAGDGTAALPAFAFDSDKDIGMYRVGANQLGFATAGTSRVVVDASGNVGIGTTSPSAPLAFGKAVYGDPSSEDFYRIKFKDNGGINNDVGIGMPDANSLGFNTVSNGKVIFYNGTDGETMRIDSSGNVGIGVSSPSAKLDVNGSAEFASTVEIGSFSSTTAAAVFLGSGAVQAFRDSGVNASTSPVFIGGRKDGSSSVTNVSIFANGSANFAGVISTTGQNTVNTASSLKISQESANVSQIRAYGSDGSTVGSLEFRVSASDGAPSYISLTLNNDGSATFAGAVTAQSYVTSSDQRFKENITDANSQLADVTALGNKLRNWDWTADAPVADKGTRFLGLVAQEAETICPGIVKTIARTKQGAELTPETTDEEGNVTPATYEELDDSYKGISHDALIMKLLGAVAELSAKVAALEAG